MDELDDFVDLGWDFVLEFNPVAFGWDGLVFEKSKCVGFWSVNEDGVDLVHEGFLLERG